MVILGELFMAYIRLEGLKNSITLNEDMFFSLDFNPELPKHQFDTVMYTPGARQRQ
jgi:hypothetical protein